MMDPDPYNPLSLRPPVRRRSIGIPVRILESREDSSDESLKSQQEDVDSSEGSKTSSEDPLFRHLYSPSTVSVMVVIVVRGKNW